jgi:hypothetical protein
LRISLIRLRTFADDWRRKQEENYSNTKKALRKERALLIQKGVVTPKLRQVLWTIFAMYSSDREQTQEEMRLPRAMAMRLWYRCGLNLDGLEGQLDAEEGGSPTFSFADFMDLVGKIVTEDEAEFNETNASSSVTVSTFEVCIEIFLSLVECRFGISIIVILSPQVGDKVELVERYETYGDAGGGPLQVGDRGVVVEIQRGPNGEKYVADGPKFFIFAVLKMQGNLTFFEN